MRKLIKALAGTFRQASTEPAEPVVPQSAIDAAAVRTYLADRTQPPADLRVQFWLQGLTTLETDLLSTFTPEQLEQACDGQRVHARVPALPPSLELATSFRLGRQLMQTDIDRMANEAIRKIQAERVAGEMMAELKAERDAAVARGEPWRPVTLPTLNLGSRTRRAPDEDDDVLPAPTHGASAYGSSPRMH